jgi:hypothetical protein
MRMHLMVKTLSFPGVALITKMRGAQAVNSARMAFSNWIATILTMVMRSVFLVTLLPTVTFAMIM